MKNRQIPLQGKGRRFRADLWLDEKNHRADAECAADARHQVPRWLESPENAGVQAGVSAAADAVPAGAGRRKGSQARSAASRTAGTGCGGKRTIIHLHNPNWERICDRPGSTP